MATKRKTQGVSIQPELLAKALDRAGDKGFSNYVVSLIENDIAGTLSIRSRSPLAELARVFHPTRELFFTEEMGEYDQGLVIMRFLEALLEAVRRESGFEPEAPFALYNSTEQLVEVLKQKTPKSKFDLIQNVVDELLVAEEKGKYGKKPKA